MTSSLIVGVWNLVTYQTRPVTGGEPGYPLGEDAIGRII
jgi:hypothetical protein